MPRMLLPELAHAVRAAVFLPLDVHVLHRDVLGDLLGIRALHRNALDDPVGSRASNRGVLDDLLGILAVLLDALVVLVESGNPSMPSNSFSPTRSATATTSPDSHTSSPSRSSGPLARWCCTPHLLRCRRSWPSLAHRSGLANAATSIRDCPSPTSFQPQSHLGFQLQSSGRP